MYVSTEMKMHTCLVCGVEFPHRSGGNANKCCSRACGFRYLAIKSALNARPKPALRPLPDTKYTKVATIRVCGYCGFAFIRPYGSMGSYKFCGPVCVAKSRKEIRRKARTEHRKRFGPDSSHRKRARKFGCAIGTVNRIKLFEQCGWKCCACGQPTPRWAMGQQLSNSPELDHIIPLSKGGAHMQANVQLLCRACNSAKGNSIGWAKHAA